MTQKARLVQLISQLPSQAMSLPIRVSLPTSTLGGSLGQGSVLEISERRVALDGVPIEGKTHQETIEQLRDRLTALNAARSGDAGGGQPPAGVDVDADLAFGANRGPNRGERERRQPDVADAWSILHVGAPRIIQFFSDHIGPYAYPQFTVVQAGDGGMEYPMLVFIGGSRTPQSLYSVLSHEIAHEWWPMMVGSNESLYAWQDEGLASYVEDLSLQDYFDGETPALDQANTDVTIATATTRTEERRGGTVCCVAGMWGGAGVGLV